MRQGFPKTTDQYLADVKRYDSCGASLAAGVSLEAAFLSVSDETELQTSVIELAKKVTADPLFIDRAIQGAAQNLERARRLMAYPLNMEQEEVGLLITLISDAYALTCLFQRLGIKTETRVLDLSLQELAEFTDNYSDKNFLRELSLLRSNGFVPLPPPLSLSEQS